MHVLISGLDKLLEYIPATEQEIGRALRNAINATARQARKSAIDRIVSETGLIKKTVEGRIYAQLTTQDSMTAHLKASNRRIPLYLYSPRVSFAGSRGTVTADVSMLRGPQVITNRVFANPYNQDNIMQRQMEKKAYPVQTPTGPSVGHHVDRIKESLSEEANELLTKTFEQKLQDQIEKRK